MLSRVHRLLSFASNDREPANDQAYLGAFSSGPQILTGDISGSSYDDDTSATTSSGIDPFPLFSEGSAGNFIFRHNSYPTASGGHGDVYKCTRKRDSGSDEVAVKAPRFAKLSEIEKAKVDKSINREVQIWDCLKHQYVLPFEGTVEGFGQLRAFVSLWMPNGNLNSYLNRMDVSLTAMDKLILLRQITNGLKYLHENNVIHGDLTSNNVLIAADGSPRLADYGISNIIRQPNNPFSYHHGAARWVAPECMILQDEEATRCGTMSADIYALGCIILEVLCGKVPYWWIKQAMHVIAAKFKMTKPINSSIRIESNHLDFMQRCWSDESETRPSVDDVLAFLDASCSLEECSFEAFDELLEDAYKSIPNVSSTQPELDVASPRDLTKFIRKIKDHPVAGGGFGDIWRCIYQSSWGQTIVAVKSPRVFASNMSDEVMGGGFKSIRRELDVCAGIKHQNIMPLLGYTTGFGPFIAIVTPWAENGNLTTYLTCEDARLSTARRFEILRDVTDGLQYLHTCNVIHGDLTGPNVLIHRDGTACLSDFGLSLRYSDSVSVSQADWTTKFHGNLPWMAPELLRQPDDGTLVRPSKSSDIYAFGGIMLHVLTSKIPYYYLEIQYAIITSVTTGNKPDRSRYPSFPDAYWDIIGKCWSAVETRPSAKEIFEVIGDELEFLSSSNTDS